MNNDQNPLLTIKLPRVAEEGSAFIFPQDFANRPLVRALLPASGRRIYSGLRVCGLSKGEAFMAAFGQQFIATPDALMAAAEIFDASPLAQREMLEAFTAADPHTLRAEWQRQVDALSFAARDAAMHLRVELANYSPSADQDATERDHAQLREILAKNAAALADGRGDGVDWSARRFEGE
jgi:hypothetical protein